LPTTHIHAKLSRLRWMLTPSTWRRHSQRATRDVMASSFSKLPTSCQCIQANNSPYRSNAFPNPQPSP